MSESAQKQWNKDMDETLRKLVASKDLLPSRDVQMLKRGLESLQLRLRATDKPEVMDTRLIAGLDYAQRGFERLDGLLPLNPSKLPKWNCMNKPLFPIFQKLTSMEEAFMDSHKTHDVAPGCDSFQDLRQTLLHIAKACDNDSLVGKR